MQKVQVFLKNIWKRTISLSFFCGKFKINRKVVKVTKDTKGMLTKWQLFE